MSEEEGGVPGNSCCAVCEQNLSKARFHYGGISCYSCRAFFRRNTQRSELPLCKGEGRCCITAAVRKQCAACRYDKCIRIGMRPELVLDDDEKKTRFRKFLQKKQDDRETSDGRVSQGDHRDMNNMDQEHLEEMNRSPPFVSPPPGPSSEMRRLSPSSSSSSPGARLEYPRMNKDISPKQVSNNYLLGPQVNEIKTEIPCMNYPTYPSHHPYHVHTHTYTQPPTHPYYPEYPDSGYRDDPRYRYYNEHQKYMMPYTNPYRPENKYYHQNVITAPTIVKKEEEDVEKNKEVSLITDLDSIEPTIQTTPDLPSTSSKTYQTFLRPKEEEINLNGGNEKPRRHSLGKGGFNTHEQLLQQYVNKRFPFGQLAPESLIAELGTATMKRKSVIVRAGSGLRKSASHCRMDDDNIDNLIDNALSLIPNASDIIRSFDLDTIVPSTIELYTNEEEDSIRRLVDHFNEKWHEINFGEYLVGEYIKCCQYRTEFPLEFFKMVNLTLRERCLNFACSLDEVDSIPAEQQICLFRRNLDNLEMLAYVFNFNQQSWVEEIDFVLGAQDKRQFNARPSGLEGLPLSIMITHMPISEEEKMELYRNMCSCLLTAITDKTVLILMMLIVTFDQDKDDPVCPAADKIKNNYVNMLMRYLGNKRRASIELDMNMIYDCISLLPAIARTFSVNKRIVQQKLTV